jgi:hypothetical protein
MTENGAQEVGRPLEWVVLADGIRSVSLPPVHADGTHETGDIEKQTDLTVGHLRNAVGVASGAMDDVVEVKAAGSAEICAVPPQPGCSGPQHLESTKIVAR